MGKGRTLFITLLSFVDSLDTWQDLARTRSNQRFDLSFPKTQYEKSWHTKQWELWTPRPPWDHIVAFALAMSAFSLPIWNLWIFASIHWISTKHAPTCHHDPGFGQYFFSWWIGFRTNLRSISTFVDLGPGTRAVFVEWGGRIGWSERVGLFGRLGNATGKSIYCLLIKQHQTYDRSMHWGINSSPTYQSQANPYTMSLMNQNTFRMWVTQMFQLNIQRRSIAQYPELQYVHCCQIPLSVLAKWRLQYPPDTKKQVSLGRNLPLIPESTNCLESCRKILGPPTPRTFVWELCSSWVQ